ncbi:MarR family winged helix-turn-helix transcriptional regulator [Gordonia hankookensis]|uniref:MarR family transcriptional regulator n=1 Tax=Gordonia hankookensis TaxID=589403 RepID=A0ABR7WEN3_9ACTN|nr:MarR family transcriptional regulator [Gordonia hankookensis]MBD1321120.1 MarR family transcriptional regulator [Gordonia hankookensis]
MSAAPSASDPRREAWQVFIETSARLQTVLDDDLKASAGMSLADYQVLLLLHDAPRQRLRMRDLSEHLVFSTSRLSYQIDTLVRRGWLGRERADEDRRGSYAVLTPRGAEVFRNAARDHARCVRTLFIDALSETDGVALLDIMTRLSGHMSSQHETGGRR